MKKNRKQRQTQRRVCDTNINTDVKRTFSTVIIYLQLRNNLIQPSYCRRQCNDIQLAKLWHWKLQWDQFKLRNKMQSVRPVHINQPIERLDVMLCMEMTLEWKKHQIYWYIYTELSSSTYFMQKYKMHKQKRRASLCYHFKLLHKIL